MDELLSEFQSEAKSLTGQLMPILEAIEEDPGQFKDLEKFGQIVDRIMGTATSLSSHLPDYAEILNKIGAYGKLCKTVSYKASQVEGNPNLITVVVAFLLDATEMLEEMINTLSDTKALEMKDYLNKTFLDRLQWVTQHLGKDLRSTLGASTQSEIDQLLKSMGV